MKPRETIDVWVTRDSTDGDEPSLLMLHASKPTLRADGNWVADTACMVLPGVKHGRCERVRLELE